MGRRENLTYLDYLLRRFSALPYVWWSRGGVLKGESAPRIAYLREFIKDLMRQPAGCRFMAYGNMIDFNNRI